MTAFLDACYMGIKRQVGGIPDTIRVVSEADRELLVGKRLVILVGAGDSYAVAEYGKWVFLAASINAVTLSPPEIGQIALDEGCLVIGITASGRSLRTVQALEYARSRKATTVVLTDNREGRAVGAADYVWFTKSGVETYDIAPTAPTTCAMVYLLALVSEGQEQGFSSVSDDLSVFKDYCRTVLDWAEQEGERIAGLIDIQKHLYLIADGVQSTAALVGMMKLHEFSLLRSTPVAREEFQHHYNLCAQAGDLAMLISGAVTKDGDIEYIRVLIDTLKMQVFRLEVPKSLRLSSDLGQAVANTIALQFGAYYAVKRIRPDMEWFRLPNAKAFKIY